MSVLLLLMAAGAVISVTWATWNPSDKAAGITLSNGNLTETAGGGQTVVRSTISKSSGKWYWEVTVGAATSLNIGIGVSQSGHSLTSYLGSDTISGCYGYNGTFYYNGGAYGTTGSSYTTGDIIGVAIDFSAGSVVFYKNGVQQTQTIPISGTIFAAVGGLGGGDHSSTTNFGATVFAYTPPSGHSGLSS